MCFTRKITIAEVIKNYTEHTNRCPEGIGGEEHLQHMLFILSAKCLRNPAAFLKTQSFAKELAKLNN